MAGKINLVVEKLLDRVKNQYLNSYMVLVADMAISLLSSFLVLGTTILVSDTFVIGGLFSLVWMVSSLVGSLLFFVLLRTYRIVIRHTTFKDVMRFGFATMLKALVMFASVFVFCEVFTPVVVMLLLDFLVTFFIIIGVRLTMIYVYDSYKSRIRTAQKRKRVLIYGTSDKALALITRLRNAKHFELLGMISPDTSLSGKTFEDKKMYTFTDEKSVAALAKSLSLSGIIFATDGAAQREQYRLIKFCTDNEVQVLIVPTIDEIGDNPVDSVRLRDVKIEDLLGREEIKISLDSIKQNFAGKTIMVTGAAGSIGSELCRQLATFGIGRLILFDNAETPMHNLRLELEERWPDLDFVPVIGDVRALPRLDFAFRSNKPQIVFHAAAYKHVPLMEENPCEAVLVNVVGSRQVADKCIEYGIEKMVMISTDKAVNPTNIMGCSKRLAEIYVQSLGLAIENGEREGNTKFVTTRFGNVLGSNGSVIPRFRDQIAKGGPVTVTHPDITRFFMTIPEACRLVMEAANMPTENRICVFDMGESVKIDTLARRMIELSGLEPDKDIKVEYTGLRPGEKLYEEVLSNVENTEPTTHDRIRIARVRSYKYSDAEDVVDRLETLSRSVDIPTMVKLMKEVVPEYISNNSKYTVYDKK